MALQEDLASAQRFAHDLRAIREAKGLTIERVHHETMIPHGVIEEFEHNALIENPQFNRVYLRSFVRTYAATLHIEEKLALEALEEALSGIYQHRLAARYLDEGEGPPPGTPPAGSETGPPEASSRSEKQSTEPASPRPERGPPGAKPARAPIVTSVEARRPPLPPPTPATKTDDRSPARDAAGPVVVGLAIATVIVLGVLLFLWQRNVSSAPDEPAPAIPSDSVTPVGTTPPELMQAPLEEPARIEVGDEIDVLVIAAGQPVQRLLVQIDDDLRRPYWIEPDSTIAFQAEERIALENQLSRIQLRVEGVPYPLEPAPGPQLVLTRGTVQNFLDSVRTIQPPEAD